jgi:heme/copper-type cytochrome/quinol oxidase subunit 4
MKRLIAFALAYSLTLVSLVLVVGDDIDKWELAAIPLFVAAAAAVMMPTRSWR